MSAHSSKSLDLILLCLNLIFVKAKSSKVWLYAPLSRITSKSMRTHEIGYLIKFMCRHMSWPNMTLYVLLYDYLRQAHNLELNNHCKHCPAFKEDFSTWLPLPVELKNPMTSFQAASCGRCRFEQQGDAGKECSHCKLDDLLMAWELRAFDLQTHALAKNNKAITAEDALLQVGQSLTIVFFKQVL